MQTVEAKAIIAIVLRRYRAHCKKQNIQHDRKLLQKIAAIRIIIFLE